MKSKFLIFDTNHHAGYETMDIKDGKVSKDDKEWIVDKAKPVLLEKAGFFSRFLGASLMPLYLLKWNILLPVDYELKETKMKFDELLNSANLTDGMKKELQDILKKDEKVKDSTWVLKELVAMDVKFPRADAKENEFAVTPEFLKSTADMRFLKNMKNYAGGEGGSRLSRKRIMDILFIGGMILLVFVSLAITGVIHA
jgi:hypothetical protein